MGFASPVLSEHNKNRFTGIIIRYVIISIVIVIVIIIIISSSSIIISTYEYISGIDRLCGDPTWELLRVHVVILAG